MYLLLFCMCNLDKVYIYYASEYEVKRYTSIYLHTRDDQYHEREYDGKDHQPREANHREKRARA